MDKEKKITLAFNFELGKIINVLDELHMSIDNYTWLCTVCKKPLFYNRKLACFLHSGNRNYCFEPETIEHKTMKTFSSDKDALRIKDVKKIVALNLTLLISHNKKPSLIIREESLIRRKGLRKIRYLSFSRMEIFHLLFFVFIRNKHTFILFSYLPQNFPL